MTPKPFSGEHWGFDNGAYSYYLNGEPFNEAEYLKRLDRAYCKGPPYMAVCPDKVGAGLESLDFSEQWREKLPAEWPWYLAVQDGMAFSDVEPILGSYAGIFLGGTNAFKFTARPWREMAHRNGKLFHYGRAGTLKKVQHATDVGADSLDSAFPLWTVQRFEQFIELVNVGHPQSRLTFMENA